MINVLPVRFSFSSTLCLAREVGGVDGLPSFAVGGEQRSHSASLPVIILARVVGRGQLALGIKLNAQGLFVVPAF